jgi:hypothetical protein
MENDLSEVLLILLEGENNSELWTRDGHMTTVR